MKEYKYLYQKMLEDEVIRKAYKKLRKGKTKRKEIIKIDADLDNEVAAMREMILNTKPYPVEPPEKAYRPRKRIPKFIEEKGKKRRIYMPEIHEQWLHHIIVLVLEPIITATAYKYSCGSFPNRGAHYGKKQLEKWIKSGKGIRCFAKLDIRHFYDSIQLKILLRELSIRIKDDWFLYVVEVSLSGFEKGIPLGFYISQWFANYLLEPLDRLIQGNPCIKAFIRYMDDVVFGGPNKKKLHAAIIEVMKMLGRRFRLKLKDNYQVFRFDYVKKDGKRIGRPLDFMGFLFFRDKTLIRKRIMIAATKLAKRMNREKEIRKGYFRKHISAMISYLGWFDCTNTYDCYEEYIKPFVNIGRLKKITSKLQRRQNHETVDRGTLLRAA